MFCCVYWIVLATKDQIMVLGLVRSCAGGVNLVWFETYRDWFVTQVNYGEFMNGLSKENISLNRKVLSEIAMHEPYSFKSLVDISRIAFTQVKTKQ